MCSCGCARVCCTCMCVGVYVCGVRGDGYRFSPSVKCARGMFSAVIISVMDVAFLIIMFLNPVYLFIIIIISLNAFDVALMFVLHLLFK